MSEELLSAQEYFKSVLNYNSETGIFIWKRRLDAPTNWNNRFEGTVAGSIVCCNGRDYINIGIHDHTCKAHRIAWLYIHGEHPEFIDHIDDDGTNNRIKNLRPATRSQNLANSYKLDRGVFEENGKYRAMIRVNGKLIHLGIFAERDEAQGVYNIAADKHFGKFARINRVA